MNSFRPLWDQPYASTTLLAGVLAGALACLVMWRSPRSPTARGWTILCSCVAGWAFWNVLSLLSVSESDALRYLRLGDAIALFIPVTFVHFAMHFAERLRPRVLRVAYGVTMAVALTVWTPWFMRGGQWKFDMWFEQGGPTFVAFAVLFVALPAYGIHLLLQAARGASGARRAQLICMAFACGLGFSGGFMWFLPALGVDIPPIGGHWIALYCFVAMYAILRYQFLDIRIIIRKSVVYSALVTMLTLGYFIVAFIGERYFQTTLGYRSVALSVVLFAGMALAFQPVKRWLQQRVDQWLLPEPKETLTRRLEELEREVREADKGRAVGQLAAGVAHEIKNPLVAIRTFMEILPVKHGDAAFLEQFQQVVGRELTQLQRLAQGLVDFAKPHPPQRQPVDLGAVLEDVLALTRPELTQRGVAVTTQYQHNGAVFVGDAGQLSQVFLNLILNAHDAMAGGGRLTVATRTSTDAVEVVITDTGQGIAPAHLARLFEPFVSTKPHGTGLGLSIVQRIVQEHGGTITVKSHLGRGTTFIVRLPLQPVSP